VRDTTPLGVLREQRDEWLRIALVERVGCRAKLVDHAREYARRGYARPAAAPPIVELLYFEGCPTHRTARALIERVTAEQGLAADLRLVEVASPDEAEPQRFLGSPSIRVNGHEIEPRGRPRDVHARLRRLYRTEAGLSGLPAEAWLRAALRVA
jgi:hypothetical protein